MVESEHKRKSIVNVLTIDVEEWYQTVLFNKNIVENKKVSNLLNNIYEIVDILDEFDTKATFFIVGSVAEKYPCLVKMIAQKGHEIASHSYDHKLVYKMSKQEFLSDTRISLDILEQNAQAKILGYRAPTWSITKNNYWAIDVLKSLGLTYDSSIYHFGLNGQRPKNLFYEIRDGFIEFPPSVFNLLGLEFPFAGGTFLRFLPANFITGKISEINRTGVAAMGYFHSWEFDYNVPMSGIEKWKVFIQYHNLNSVRKKLDLILRNFKFASIKDILCNYAAVNIAS